MGGVHYRVGAVVVVLAIGLSLAGAFVTTILRVTSFLPGGQQTAIVSAALVVFTAVYTASVAQWIQQRVWGPVIRVSFEQRPPWCVESALSLEREEVEAAEGQYVLPDDLHAYFFRMQITNEGIGPARDCEVLLERIWRVEDEAWAVVPWEPVNLHWAGDKKLEAVTQVNRGRTRFCDVGHVLNETAQRHAEERRLFIDFRPRPTGGRLIVDVITHYAAQPSGWGAGTYAFSVAVYAANAVPERASFLLEYDGSFASVWDPAIENEWAGVRLRPIRKVPKPGSAYCEEALVPKERL